VVDFILLICRKAWWDGSANDGADSVLVPDESKTPKLILGSGAHPVSGGCLHMMCLYDRAQAISTLLQNRAVSTVTSCVLYRMTPNPNCLTIYKDNDHRLLELTLVLKIEESKNNAVFAKRRVNADWRETVDYKRITDNVIQADERTAVPTRDFLRLKKTGSMNPFRSSVESKQSNDRTMNALLWRAEHPLFYSF
jgi:hypothetical protein